MADIVGFEPGLVAEFLGIDDWDARFLVVWSGSGRFERERSARMSECSAR